MKPLARAALAVLLFTAAACGKQTFLAAALLGTPQVANPIQPSQPIPAQTFTIAYLGTVDTSNPTKIDASKIGTVVGAKGSIAYHSALQNADNDLPLVDRKDGSYTLDSQTNARLTNETGQPYTLVLVGGDGNEAYGAKLLPPPTAEIKEFHASKYLIQAPGSFTVTRSDGPVGGRLLPAFVVVMKVDPQNPGNISLDNAVFTTVPKDSSALLKFALSDEDYRKPSFVVPAASIPKGFYVVALLVIRYGLVSENTFLGSTAMAGNGDAGLLAIQ